MEIINSSNFDEVTLSGLVLVDFFAEWCGPCKMLAPILEELDNEIENVKVVKIDVDQNQDIAIRYGIQAIPNLVIFKDGKAVDQITGFTSKNELIKHLEVHF